MTTVREAADDARRKLMGAGIETAALDARLLLQAATGLRHQELVADPDHIIHGGDGQELQAMVERRVAHEPVSRILGRREFYGRTFNVTSAVLDPRSDTETLIEAALKYVRPDARILDLGTGAGAIIVTLLAECPAATGVATDLSADALSVAKGNAVRLGVAERLQWVHCSWFDAVTGTFDLIVSNPPYIPLSDFANLPLAVRGFDPLLALDGGPDGIEAYRRIAAGAEAHLAPSGRLLVEIGSGQQGEVSAVFAASGFSLETPRIDLAGHVRCLVFTRS